MFQTQVEPQAVRPLVAKKAKVPKSDICPFLQETLQLTFYGLPAM